MTLDKMTLGILGSIVTTRIWDNVMLVVEFLYFMTSITIS